MALTLHVASVDWIGYREPQIKIDAQITENEDGYHTLTFVPEVRNSNFFRKIYCCPRNPANIKLFFVTKFVKKTTAMI